MKKFLLFLLFASVGPRLLVGDDHNPIGVTGAFEGVITTGGAYNVLNHNVTRRINDIVVPGAIGKYPLKMTRYYNSRSTFGYDILGPGWTHEYLWTSGNDRVKYPNGSVWDSHCTGDWGLGGPLGVSDWPTTWNGYPAFRLADGGTIVFGNAQWTSVATKIIDPYGQETNITLDNSGKITRVTEPGGRYLQFSYTTYNGVQVLNRVDAYDGQGHQIDWVVYHYASKPTGGTIVTTAVCLTSVDYSDGQHATYTYTTDNSPENPSPPCPCPLKLSPLVIGCDDARYQGAMRRIAYQYQQSGPHGAILREKYWDGVAGNEANGPTVSRIDPPAPSPLLQGVTFPTTYTETRGDSPTRTFNYTPLSVGRPPNEDVCPSVSGPAPQQFLLSYTDFQGHTTYLGYDTNWYVNSVRDANNHTTSYTRGPPPNAYPGSKGTGQILRITHPGGNHIDYTYYDEGSGNISGHYLQQITTERGAVTYHFRDGNHRITRTDYKDANGNLLANETFSYNSFGQVETHRLKNGAWESFVYGGRGLLIDKYNPKQGGAPGGTDPHTHYTYYTSGPWTDRVQTVTLPANVSNNVAFETYEYDRAFDANGVTNLSGAAVAGRGLVTKITHADGKYQRFKYDAYGKKRWEDNELRKITSYTYDDYNRLLTVTDPLSKTTQYDYAPAQGNTTQSRQHTANSPWWITMPSGILTHNVYDDNWRKTSTVVASGTLNLTTRFAYDNVGNLTDVTDPRSKITHNSYDNRNRKTSTTEAYGITGLAATTVWHYDGASNINQIDRPDGIHETKGFDALNRMIWHTVPRQVIGGGQINITTNITYNPSGTIQKVRDANGRETNFSYDASDRKIMMTYPGTNGTQQWAYDNAGNLKSRTTVSGKRQDFSYDNCNRKIGMSWSNGADSASYGYDDAGRLTSASNPNSTVTRVYDAAGRLTNDQQNVIGLGIKNVTYPLYDDDGKVKQISAGGVYDYTFGYDAAGRFETISTGGSVKFQYAYDAASNETHRYSVLSVVIDQVYNRDSLNRMASRLLKKNGATIPGTTESYTYDHMNRITEANRGGTADDFGYYWDGELLSAQYGGGPQAPYAEEQEPDLDTTDTLDLNAGYQPPETAEAEPASPPDDTPPSDSTPDTTPSPDVTPPSDTPPAEDPAKGEKTVEDYLGDGNLAPDGPEPDLFTGRSVTYNLDKAGNRTSVTDNVNGNATYAPNPLNQYTSVGGSSVTNGPEHEIRTYNSVTYNYINDEHLKQVISSSSTYDLYYDALGRCVKRTLNGLTTYYIYDGEKPILEYRSSDLANPAKNVYGKGIDEILMRYDPSFNPAVTYYYQQDHEGSVSHLLNTSGDVIESYKYDAFGAPAIYDANGTQLSSSAYSNRFLFTGREYANVFGFYEYRARAYNPTLGRFMSEDPKLFDAGDYNLFRYCHNDPVDFTDAMGTTDSAVTYSPRQESLERVDITNAERISLWQKSMESSIGGERASNALQDSKTLAMPGVEKRSSAGPYPHPKNYQEYLAQVRAIEGGNPGLESPAFNPLDLLSGVFAGKAVLTGAAKAVAPGEGTQLFRVFGNEAKGLGQYYTTVNPANVANYRQAAGLFPKNSGQFVLQGALKNIDGVIFSKAAPGPGGVGGGLPQVFVPSPQMQINILRVSGANPEF